MSCGAKAYGPADYARLVCENDVASSIHLEDDVVAALPASEAEVDHAIDTAGAGDVIVIAGKGHEDYQIVGTERRHFDDVEVAAAVASATAVVLILVNIFGW